MTCTNEDMTNQIEKFIEIYYSQNSKNAFFKKNQKMEIARQVSKTFGLSELIEKTAFVIPNTNKIFLDYTTFKTFANETNYEEILMKIMSLYEECIKTHGKYEVHVNLHSLTTSAVERYKTCIDMFNAMTSSNQFSCHMSCWYVYNPPSVIEIIRNMLKFVLQPVLLQKVIVISKKESQAKLNELFSMNYDDGEHSEKLTNDEDEF